MFKKKEDYVVIAFGAVLVIIVSIIAIISTNYSRSQQTQEENPEISATKSVTQTVPTTTQNTPPDFTNTRPPFLYDKRSDDKMMDLIENRQPISNADALAKAKILTLLPQDNLSGIVHETSTIKIDYTQSADIFQVEILTTDVQAAKEQANVWLREQGLSQEAICTLPVVFYVSYDVANQLRNTNVVVSSLGNSCI